VRTTLPNSNVTKSQLGMAIVVLIGILVVAYGYFRQSKAGLYVGLLVTVAGVLYGVIQIVTRRGT
jgi:hypothetical protein